MANRTPVNVEYEDDEIMDNIMPPDIFGFSLFVLLHGDLMTPLECQQGENLVMKW